MSSELGGEQTIIQWGKYQNYIMDQEVLYWMDYELDQKNNFQWRWKSEVSKTPVRAVPSFQ